MVVYLVHVCCHQVWGRVADEEDLMGCFPWVEAGRFGLVLPASVKSMSSAFNADQIQEVSHRVRQPGTRYL